MTITLAKDVRDYILRVARAAHPLECCGILLGEEQIIQQAVSAKNVHPDPHTHFEIDPQALIDAHRAAREGGPQVLGYYHSHPEGAAAPSGTDVAMASGDGRVWAIIGRGAVQFWRDGEGGFAEVSYRLLDG